MFTLPDLTFAYDALEPYIDKATMELHHDKHHAAYVKNLNEALSGHEDLLNMEIDELLKNIDKVPAEIRTKVRNNGGGHSNHTIFWSILAPGKGGEPAGKLAESITQTFGDFSTFKEQLSKAALNQFGSGWGWLAVDQGKLVVLSTPNQDTPLAEGKVPLLGIDVWEHAYYLKYQNRRAEYLKNIWNVINWEEIEKRFDRALKP